MHSSGHSPDENSSPEKENGRSWCFKYPEILFALHLDGQRFIAIHPHHGVVFSAEDEETFDAKIAERRPSVLRQLFFTCTHLWVGEGVA